LNVLSLFDGIGCGRMALERAGINVHSYYASEIDKHAIKVSSNAFPEIIQLGCVKDVNSKQLPNVDLLLGGFPCQAFSFCGKQLNFNDERGKLFFECERLLKECNPKYWLFENVVMKQEYQDIISERLGVKPIEINSSLVSAQNRRRLYWTNIPNVKQPDDKGINLIDIIDDNNDLGDKRNLNRATIIGRRLNTDGKRDDYNKSIKPIQYIEVRGVNQNKSNCLTTVAKDNILTPLPVGRHPGAFTNNLPFRYFSLEEYCRLQTVPIKYIKDIVSESQGKKLLGNGWTVDVIAHILRSVPD